MRGDGELKALTGIRGVAACLVVSYHFFQDSHSLGIAETFLKHGYIAVDLFFVLSGFVMALTYGSAFRTSWSFRSYLEFLYKRLGRTYPLYLAVTVFAIVQAIAQGRQLSASAIASNILLVQAWGVADSIVGPSWSISTELIAYLLFPLLAAIVLFGRRSWTFAAACVALATLDYVATRSNETVRQVYGGEALRHGALDVFGANTAYPMLRCLAGFTFGLLAYRLSHVAVVWRWASWRFAADLLLLGTLALMAVRGSDLALVLVFIPLVISLATSRSLSSRMLGGGMVYWLGVVSYSIYLTHGLVLSLVNERLQDALGQLHVPHAFTLARTLTLVLTLAISAATFYMIEQPGRNWSRRLLGGRRPGPIEAEPVPP